MCVQIQEEIDKFGIKVYQFPECDSDEDEEFKQLDKELKVSVCTYTLPLSSGQQLIFFPVDVKDTSCFNVTWPQLQLCFTAEIIVLTFTPHPPPPPTCEQECTPFAVIGSNTVVEARGQRVRGRLYPWGIVEGTFPSPFILSG